MVRGKPNNKMEVEESSFEKNNAQFVIKFWRHGIDTLELKEIFFLLNRQCVMAEGNFNQKNNNCRE